MTFLQTILIILLVYYLLKILARLLAPKILSYAAKKTEAHFRNTFGGFDTENSTDTGRDTEVFKNRKTVKNKPDSEKVGEYIDFEEID